MLRCRSFNPTSCAVLIMWTFIVLAWQSVNGRDSCIYNYCHKVLWSEDLLKAHPSLVNRAKVIMQMEDTTNRVHR